MKKIVIVCLGISIYLVFIGFKNHNELKNGNWHPVVKSITLRHKPFSVEAADLNGDKIGDLVIANSEDSSVTILLGIGNGNFAEAKGSAFAAGYMPNDIAIADFNKDGKPDLAFANHDRKYITVLAGDGSGRFSPLKGSPFSVNVIPHTHGLAVADFNRDGYLDIVTDSWGNNRLAVLFGNNRFGFNSVVKYLQVGRHPYQRVRAADFNNDGYPDLVTTNLDGNNATILLGDGKGNFKEAPGSPFACGDSPFGVAVGDVNHDGKTDLAIINSPSITSANKGLDGLTVLINDGKGNFKPLAWSPFVAGNAPSRVAIGDLNGDGNNDIAVTNYKSNNVTVFLMNKNKTPSTYTIPVGTAPDGIAIADLDGDGKGDMVVSNSGGYELNLIYSRQVYHK